MPTPSAARLAVAAAAAGRLADIPPVGSRRAMRVREPARRVGSYDITRQGPSAKSEACGGGVERLGRVITTLLSELRARNGA
jgi:hypothetical protein